MISGPETSLIHVTKGTEQPLGAGLRLGAGMRSGKEPLLEFIQRYTSGTSLVRKAQAPRGGVGGQKSSAQPIRDPAQAVPKQKPPGLRPD